MTTLEEQFQTELERRAAAKPKEDANCLKRFLFAAMLGLIIILW